MSRQALLLCTIAAAAVVAPPAAADDLLVEWADQPTSGGWARSGHVYQRALQCWTENQREICELAVITVARASCPTLLYSSAYRTDLGTLSVSRTANSVNLEFREMATTWNIHLKLMMAFGKVPIVEQASGVVVAKAVLPTDIVDSSKLVAIVKNTPYNPSREFVDVDLKCPKVQVIAAKRQAP
jgi:hypothetical protein